MIFSKGKLFATITTIVTNQYKFYVDFKGMLYFQQTKDYIYPNAIKDKKFITQLYQNLTVERQISGQSLGLSTQKFCSKQTNQVNQQNCQKELQKYPYSAQFWGQRNLVKCAIAPIIYSRIVKGQNIDEFNSNEYLKQLQFLEFSLGQYSLFNACQLRIDKKGMIWYPFIKLNSKKAKSQAQTQKSEIWGILNNELISQMLDKIAFKENQPYLNYKNKILKLRQMNDDSILKGQLGKDEIR